MATKPKANPFIKAQDKFKADKMKNAMDDLTTRIKKVGGAAKARKIVDKKTKK